MVEKCKFYCNIGPGVLKAGVSNERFSAKVKL